MVSKLLPMLSLLWLFSTSSCATTPKESSSDSSTTENAAYICETLRVCFGLRIKSCESTIIDTTDPEDIADCAACYEYATCDDIGEPGSPGDCDTACAAALFGE